MTSTKPPILFWKDHCFSQWFPSPFEVDENDYDDEEGSEIDECSEYDNAEQYMMAAKAELMEDWESRERIMKTTDPKSIKVLGRQIKNFDAVKWDANKFRIVVEGNFHKFSDERNAHMRKILMDTGDALIAEASPYDSIWGIGLGPTHPDAKDPSKWRGRLRSQSL